MKQSNFLASPDDGKDILHILESSAAKGNIELIYTRRPDAYSSYMKESGEAKVFVSKDGERSVGTCAMLTRKVYIGGQQCKAAYLCGLKKDATYTGNVGFGARFVKDLKSDDVDFYYCSVVSENHTAQKMFERSNRLISMKPFTSYKTYILNPKVKIKSPKHSFTFRQATEKDIPSLLEFLNEQGKKKDFFPVIDSIEQFYNLEYRDFYLLMDKDVIVATASLWNQNPYKQYVVKKYRSFMKFVRILNPLLSAFKYIRLPKEDEPLDFPMLSFFIARNDDVNVYRIFLNEIKNEIAKKYGMFVIGLSKEHFATPIFDKLPSINFETKLYEIRFPWSEQIYKSPNPQNSFFECGLL